MSKVLRKFAHNISTLRYVALLLLCLTTAAHASPESQTLVAEGRALLFNNGHPTYSGVITANDKFETAVAADSTDQEANLFYAVSRFMAFALEEGDTPAIDTLRELVESFGMTRTSYDRVEDGPPFTEPPQISEHLDLPDTSPGGEQVRAFLAGPFVTLLSGMLDNLNVVTDTFTTTLTASETGDEAVEVDYGDVLLARAVLSMAESAILIVNAYNLDVDIRELIALGNADIFNIQQDLLDKYQDVLKLIPTDGVQSLDEAKDALLNGITFYGNALDFIENETDGQGDDFFYFGADEDLREARRVQTILNEARDSLNENRPAIFTFIKEEWVLTDENGKRLRMDIEKDANGNFINGGAWGLDGCEFLFCSGEVEEFTVSGTDVTIRVSCGGWCPCSATLTGTLSGEQIINGAFDAINCEQSWSGQFTGTLQKTETDTTTIEFNRLFGNTGKDPLNIREILPEFDQYNEILPGTFPPTDDSSPVLNGILPEFTTNDALTKEMDLQPSGFFTIPTASISVDGDFSEWASIAPVFSDIQGDEELDLDGMDLKDFYMAQDADHYYFRMTFYDGMGIETAETSPYYVFRACSNYEDYPAGDRVCAVDPVNLDVMVLEATGGRGGYGESEATYAGFAAAGTDSIEWKVPKADMGNLAGKFVVVWTHADRTEEADIHNDYNHTRIKLETASISGTVTCSAYTSGKIFIWAYDGPDPNTANLLGSAIVNPDGTFTINGLPIGSDVYLVALWDADGNGIVTPWDYLGSSGPHTIISDGTIANFSVDEEYDVFIDEVLVWGGNSPDGPFLHLACFMWGLAPWDVESVTVYGPGGSTYVFNIEDDIRTHYEFGTYYRHKVPGALPEGRYNFVLRDREGHEYHAGKHFTPNLIDVVDMSAGISPAGGAYVNTTTPTFTWSPVTDETIGTLYYRINIMDWNRKVTIYTSDSSPDTTVTVPDGFLEPDTAYKWQVQVFDSESGLDADNFSPSEWKGFSTGAAGEPLTVERAFVRSKIDPDKDQTDFGIEIKGPAPWDARSITVTGPEGFSYTFESGDLKQDSTYKHSEDNILPDGTYTFTVVDDRNGTIISVDKEFSSNRLSIPEHLFSVLHESYIETTTPTFNWSPVTDETADPVYYRIHIFDYRMNHIYQSERSTSTTAVVPSGILKVNNPYYWRVEVFDDASEPQNSVNTWTQSFYVLKDNPTGTISGLVDPASSGYTPGGALYVVVFDAPWLDGNMLTYTALTDVGTYTLYNLPVDSELYVYVLWDKDGSENPTPGDWMGEYSNNPISVEAGANPTDIDMALDDEIQEPPPPGARVTGHTPEGNQSPPVSEVT